MGNDDRSRREQRWWLHARWSGSGPYGVVAAPAAALRAMLETGDGRYSVVKLKCT
jgi:hypothetical protein